MIYEAYSAAVDDKQHHRCRECSKKTPASHDLHHNDRNSIMDRQVVCPVDGQVTQLDIFQLPHDLKCYDERRKRQSNPIENAPESTLHHFVHRKDDAMSKFEIIANGSSTRFVGHCSCAYIA